MQCCHTTLIMKCRNFAMTTLLSPPVSLPCVGQVVRPGQHLRPGNIPALAWAAWALS